MSIRDKLRINKLQEFLVLCSITLGSCATRQSPTSEFIEAENKIVTRLAGLQSGQSLFGVFKDIGLDEKALKAKTVVVPLRPAVVMTLGHVDKWLKLKIEFDRPLYQMEFSNVALGMTPYNYEKSGPLSPPKVKSMEIIYFDPSYKFLSYPVKLSALKFKKFKKPDLLKKINAKSQR
jgi:hypothetical protein